MRRPATGVEDRRMTTTPSTPTAVEHVDGYRPAPLSRLVRVVCGVSLVLGGLLNGLSQYIGEQMTGDLEFTEQIRWGAEHPALHAAEQTSMLVSILFIPIGILGLAQVCRWRAPVLTATATALFIWGMWGFQNVLAMGYVTGTVAPGVIGTEQAMLLNDSLIGHGGAVATALVPHLVGSFVGLLLLSAAAWRSGSFSRVASVMLVAFGVWDFLLPSAGLFEPHLLLAVGWAWWGVQLVRMPDDAWRGRLPAAVP
jgi:hypothetical protein